MADAPRSSTPTSGMSLRMPQAVRRRIRIAAGLDDMLVRDWVVEVLDIAARERMAAASVEMVEETMAVKPDERRPRRRLTCDQVIETVAAYYGWTRPEMSTRSRRRELLRPRQVAMYFCRQHTDATDRSIGEAFDRAHTAVVNAFKVVGERSDEHEIRAIAETLDRMQGQGSVDEEEPRRG